MQAFVNLLTICPEHRSLQTPNPNPNSSELTRHQTQSRPPMSNNGLGAEFAQVKSKECVIRVPSLFGPPCRHRSGCAAQISAAKEISCTPRGNQMNPRASTASSKARWAWTHPEEMRRTQEHQPLQATRAGHGRRVAGSARRPRRRHACMCADVCARERWLSRAPADRTPELLKTYSGFPRPPRATPAEASKYAARRRCQATSRSRPLWRLSTRRQPTLRS